MLKHLNEHLFDYSILYSRQAQVKAFKRLRSGRRPSSVNWGYRMPDRQEGGSGRWLEDLRGLAADEDVHPLTRPALRGRPTSELACPHVVGRGLDQIGHGRGVNGDEKGSFLACREKWSHLSECQHSSGYRRQELAA